MKRVFLILGLCAFGASADEGLWLYEQFPKQQVEKKYGFKVSNDFLNHLRLSSLKMGASASFVSPKGLIFTNHHVASGCIQRVSSAEHNYMANGFYAATEADEIKCPGTEANVLLKTEDVTKQVVEAVKAAPGTPEAARERRAAMARIEKDCSKSTGDRCDVVTLYSGALFHLYQYKKYTDIRLVFAPEEAIAFFGGDPDNFTYPRYDLDITFLRAYEDGHPADTPNFLKWSPEGAKDGELVFVSGNPASTDRFITYSQLAYMRDTTYPMQLAYLKSAIATLKAYGSQSAEAKRVARDKLFSAENSYKAQFWEFKGLQDSKLFAEKKAREDKLRAAISKNHQVAAEVGDAWEKIAAAISAWAPHQKENFILERGPVFSDLFRIARTVLRLPGEKAKPNGERLREFTDAALPSLELRLYSPAPISDSVEIATLTNYFQFMQAQLGADNPTAKAVLAGRSPEEAARYYVSGTKLKDVAERKRLANSLEEVKQSQDTMIELARTMDPAARAIHKLMEDTFDAPVRAEASRIARARFSVYGSNEYPDATFTLRLSYGPVKAYRNDAGKPVSSTTDFAGMYKHATGEDPFKLPESFLKAKEVLTPTTSLNFVSTCDIIGGNSGSPTVNTRGEIVGILFDSNLEAMPNRFVYSEVQARAVHVASQGILEALRKVYHADRVVAELGFGK